MCEKYTMHLTSIASDDVHVHFDMMVHVRVHDCTSHGFSFAAKE